MKSPCTADCLNRTATCHAECEAFIEYDKCRIAACKEYGWKKSTMYTMLRRLCQRGIFAIEDGLVVTRITREEFDSRQSHRFVQDSFGGSLPRFLTAFCSRKSLSDEEIEELSRLIDAQRRK